MTFSFALDLSLPLIGILNPSLFHCTSLFLRIEFDCNKTVKHKRLDADILFFLRSLCVWVARRRGRGRERRFFCRSPKKVLRQVVVSLSFFPR